MKIPLLVAAASFGAIIALSQSVQALDCGDVPPVADEDLKGEIEGKAQFLSRFLGDSELSGNLETARSDIFSKYPNADAARTNAYFLYVMCESIFSDYSMSEEEKRDEFFHVRREILGHLMPRTILGDWQYNFPLSDMVFSDIDKESCRHLMSCVVIRRLPMSNKIGERDNDLAVIENNCDSDFSILAVKYKIHDNRLRDHESYNLSTEEYWSEREGALFAYETLRPRETLKLDLSNAVGGTMEVVNCG